MEVAHVVQHQHSVHVEVIVQHDQVVQQHVDEENILDHEQRHQAIVLNW